MQISIIIFWTSVASTLNLYHQPYNHYSEEAQPSPLCLYTRQGVYESMCIWVLTLLCCQTYIKNDAQDTPLLVALNESQDEVAAKIMTYMRPAQ